MEVRLEGDSRAPHRNEEHQSLADHAQSGCDRQQPELGGCEVRNCEIFVGTPQNEESYQTRDGNDVVEHWCPHVGTEDTAGIEQLAQEVVQAVEENLRETQECESNGK